LNVDSIRLGDAARKSVTMLEISLRPVRPGPQPRCGLTHGQSLKARARSSFSPVTTGLRPPFRPRSAAAASPARTSDRARSGPRPAMPVFGLRACDSSAGLLMWDNSYSPTLPQAARAGQFRPGGYHLGRGNREWHRQARR
jgi:hypothetical protein